MRRARIRIDDRPTWYHLYNRIAGKPEELPFGEVEKEQFVRILKRCCQLYSVEVMAYVVMSNHFHLIVRASDQMPEEEEVCRRYALFYEGRRQIQPGSEKCQLWQQRCRDVSWFMRFVQQIFAQWYNRRHHRRGGLWGDRFQHTILEDGLAVWRCWAYVENNPVRAGIVASAGTYRFSSFGVWMQSGYHPFKQVIINAVLPMLRDRCGIQDLNGLRSAMIQALTPEQETEALFTVHRRVRFWVYGLVIGSQLYVDHVMRRFATPQVISRHRYGCLDAESHTLISWRDVRAGCSPA
jgi:REP element-mobilizing transposase RayT